MAWRLAVHADPMTDGLLRILGMVAVQPVEVVSVRHDQTARRASTVREIVAGNVGRVDLLAARLASAPWIRDVQVSGSERLSRPRRCEVAAADVAVA